MLNIISRSAARVVTSGPKKVLDHLVKGLDEIGYPYVINRRLDATERLWIHDDLAALREINQLDAGIQVVVGPNLVVVPRQLPNDVDLSRAVYIQPSRWTRKLWEECGFNACPIAVWAAGIDTSAFAPTDKSRQDEHPRLFQTAAAGRTGAA